MINFFGNVRDDLIREDMKAWVALNPVSVMKIRSNTVGRVGTV